MVLTRRVARLCLSLLLIAVATPASATIFGVIRGKVADQAGRPVGSARVVLIAQAADWKRTAVTDADGAFAFNAIPLGRYRVRSDANGLSSKTFDIELGSGSTVTVALTVALPAMSEQVTVSAGTSRVDPQSSTTRTTIARREIAETPGAENSNSLSMITAFVPGAYIVHDQLHVRGGHQVDWLIDGVPVPNTNIASNVGPQFDPKDVDYLEVQRGGYSAEYGDRTYAVFNVVPRTGFERNRDADLVLGFGSYRSTNDQIRFGDHTDRFAYYASINANRSDLGLETPIARVIHDRVSGVGGFSSLVWLPNAADQVRFVGSVRGDDYQIPNDESLQAQNVRDRQRERDLFGNLTWARIVSPSSLLTVSPFFHQNRANFEGGPDDPIVTTDFRRSRYAGAQVAYAATFRAAELHAGAFGFAQQDDARFSLLANDGSGAAFAQHDARTGNLEAAFVEAQRDLASWLTLRGGIRATRFSGGLSETVVSPRAGAAIRLPWFGAVVRASWGSYYQAPPLSTVSGPLEQYAVEQGFGFLPLRGERDRSAEVGLAIPLGDWTLDESAFRTEARNFFDHDVLGNSNLFLPLTIDRVHIRGIESTIHSPVIVKVLQIHLAYSHQTVQGEGGVVGGLTDFTPPAGGRFYLDHDQRNTLAAGMTWQLPRASWFAANVSYGSGFLAGNGPAHLSTHTTFDLGAGTVISAWTLKLSATNVLNKRYLLDQSNTFGGTHYADPRQVAAQISYRFPY